MEKLSVAAVTGLYTAIGFRLLNRNIGTMIKANTKISRPPPKTVFVYH